MEPALHPDVARLSFLLGTWKGRGAGHYPTIASFEYLEEVTFSHVGKPFLAYTQKTRDASSDAPLHAEAGYLRPVGVDGVELVVAQPSGIVEIHTGTSLDGTIDLRSVSVGTTPSAKQVTEVARLIRVLDDTLSYELDMAAVGRPLQNHLRATLRRL